MSDTPRTDREEYHEGGEDAFAVVSARLYRELERVITATLRELPVGNLRTHTAESIPERVAYFVQRNGELERENERLKECVEKVECICTDGEDTSDSFLLIRDAVRCALSALPNV